MPTRFARGRDNSNATAGAKASSKKAAKGRLITSRDVMVRVMARKHTDV